MSERRRIREMRIELLRQPGAELKGAGYRGPFYSSRDGGSVLWRAENGRELTEAEALAELDAEERR